MCYIANLNQPRNPTFHRLWSCNYHPFLGENWSPRVRLKRNLMSGKANIEVTISLPEFYPYVNLLGPYCNTPRCWSCKENLVSHYRPVIWSLTMVDCPVSGSWPYLSNRDDEYQVCIRIRDSGTQPDDIRCHSLSFGWSLNCSFCRKVNIISQRFYILIITLLLLGSCFINHEVVAQLFSPLQSLLNCYPINICTNPSVLVNVNTLRGTCSWYIFTDAVSILIDSLGICLSFPFYRWGKQDLDWPYP